MLRAVEQIRRMRGGAQSHLMRCSDGWYYVVKFQNNLQHRLILVNELLGTKLAARLGLPTVPVAIVQVSEELIRLTPELAVELPRSRIPCLPGLQFGSRYPGDPHRLTLFDFLPDKQLRRPHADRLLLSTKWHTRLCATLSVSRAPTDCKSYAYTAARIAARAPFVSEFAAVTDVPLLPENERHSFVRDTLRDAGIQAVAMEGFAVWVAKLKPSLQ